MAVKKGTLKRKNGAGTYDEINLKTTAEQVKMTDGTTVQAFLDSLPSGGGSNAKVVADITARDALTNAAEGLIAYVVDATGDSTVKSGGASYIYDGSNWIKISEFESMDMIIDWTDIQNKPNIVDIKVSATEPTGQIEGDIWIQETV